MSLTLRNIAILAGQAAAAEAGITFDAASNSGCQIADASYSWSHTVSASLSNRVLLVAISIMSLTSVASVTYAGQALTFEDSAQSATVRTEWWLLTNPPTGANTVAVTLSAGVDSAAGAVSFGNVSQANPIDGEAGASGSGNPATVDLTTETDGAWVLDVVATPDTAITVGAGQTQRWNLSCTLGTGASSTEGPQSPAGTVTMSWTDVAALNSWAISAIALRPSTGTGPVINVLTLSDTPPMSDEYVKQQQMGQQDDNPVQEAFVKAVGKIIDEDAAALDAIASLVIRQLVSSDDAAIEDAISKVLHALRTDDAFVSDDFAKAQQAGHEDAQASDDALAKILHALREESQDASDETLAHVVRMLLASEQIDIEDIIAKVIAAVKADDAALDDDIVKHQSAVYGEDQSADDALVKAIAKMLADDSSVSDLISGAIHKTLGDDFDAPDEFSKHLNKTVADTQDVLDEITAAIAARLVQLLLDDAAEVSDETLKQIVKTLGDDAGPSDDLFKLLAKALADTQEVSDDVTATIVGRVVSLLLDDTAEASDDALKQLRKILAEDADLLDDVLTVVIGLVVLTINDAASVADEVLKTVHSLIDDATLATTDAGAVQRIVQTLLTERQDVTDEFLKTASFVFGDEQAAAEALVKAVMKVIADGPLEFTETVVAEIVEAVVAGFIQTMLSGVNDPQGKESGIARSPRLTSAVRDIMQIASDIKGTRK